MSINLYWNKPHSHYNFEVKKIFIKLLFFLFLTSHSYACPLLTVPIGSPVSVAQNTFTFLQSYNAELFGTKISVRFKAYALDYCEGSSLENADLEVIVYDSKVAGINIISSNSEIKNEIYVFVKNNIGDPGDEVKDDNWIGYKNLSIGSLIMMYSKMEILDEVFELLEITNTEMMDYRSDERVIDMVG